MGLQPFDQISDVIDDSSSNLEELRATPSETELLKSLRRQAKVLSCIRSAESSIKAFHFNDSKKELGSRVDRHAHIGKGCIGEPGFAALMRDPRFVEIPRILETPKGDEMEEDPKNLATLRRLAGA